MQNKIKQIKKILKKENLLQTYKNKFKHKQMRFLLSKIILSIQPECDTGTLLNLEKKMLLSDIENQQKMFNEPLEGFGGIIDINANWKAFSVFLFYVYQTSTYYKDVKKGIKNVYNKDNYIKINSIKRDYYHRWLFSIPKDLEDYNLVIIKVMKRVF